MEIKKDSKGNSYVEVDNLRITYVDCKNRSSIKDWPNADVLRVQAYRGGANKSLHQGAEYPIYNDKSAYNLIEAIGKLFGNR